MLCAELQQRQFELVQVATTPHSAQFGALEEEPISIRIRPLLDLQAATPDDAVNGC